MVKKIFITGATGFVGHACLTLLNEMGFEVHALHHNRATYHNNSNIIWHHGNLLVTTDISSLIKKIRPDYLLHLAWFVDHTLFWSSEKNIDYIAATIHLYKEFSQHGGQKAVFLGTCAEYDSTVSICNETNTPLSPNTLYGIAKKQTYELLATLKQLNSYAPFSWVRLFHVYGPHENPNRLIPFIFNQYLKGKAPTLANPHAVRDFLCTTDLANILVTLLENHSDELDVINVGQGKALSISDLATLIHSKFFKQLPPPIDSSVAKDHEDCFIPDLTKLHRFNLTNPVSLEYRLENTYNWWTSQRLQNVYDRT